MKSQHGIRLATGLDDAPEGLPARDDTPPDPDNGQQEWPKLFSPTSRAAERTAGCQWCGLRLQFLVAAAMVPLFAAVYFVSYWLRFEGILGAQEIWSLKTTIGGIVTVKVLVFMLLKVHQGWSRPVTFYDLKGLAKATTASLLIILLADRFLMAASLIPRSIYVLDWSTTIVAIGGARSLLRGCREFAWTSFLPSNQIPAFIVGVNDTGELLLRAIIRDGRRAYRVMGFIDQDTKRVGIKVAGVPILGCLDQIWTLAARYGVREILVAKEGLPGTEVRRLMAEARRRGVELRVLPSYSQLLSGNVSVQPRPVAIDDLLNREPVALDMQSIRRWIDHRVLLVTGSAGSIGSEICRQLLQFSPERLVLVDRSENGQFFLERELRRLAPHMQIDVCLADILDVTRMRAILRQYRPHAIFHAAAYKHVPLMESHPAEAVKNIVVATRQLADLAVECHTNSFVMISTDKAVNPTSVMGACKRVAEMYVQSLAGHSACRFVTVRFGNVLDSAGSVIPIFRQQILEGGPITVTDPRICRYFMTIPEAAQLVIQGGAIGKGGQILLLDMGEPVRIVDLAADMIQLSGLKVGEDIAIEIVGLRPGEKLYEELYSSSEQRLPTGHPKIIVADHAPVDLDFIAEATGELADVARHAPHETIARLEDLVPEFGRVRQAATPRRAARLM